MKQSREDNEESLREITADWNLGAKTGRMSQTNPDLQTIPGRPEFTRKRFIGIAEANEEPMDTEFLMRFTGP